ncbi:MAG: sulfatase-like hydrolase/transferase [Chloroflexota bacterium]
MTASNIKPNILVIITDQLRQDHLGCYGNTIVRTPNLDRLAVQGVRCDRHYVNNPLCMPSRSTLFTGMTPRGHTVRANGINLPLHFPVLPGILASHGYQSHMVGKLHLTNHVKNVPWHRTEDDECAKLKEGLPVRGFESGEMSIGHGNYMRGAYLDWLEQKLDGAPSPWDLTHEGMGYGAEQCYYTEITEELHHSTWIGERTIDFLEERDRNRPFFLWCSFPDPHHPYCPPQEYAEMYPPEEMPLPARREGELDSLGPHFQLAYKGTQMLAGRFFHEPTLMTDMQYREIIGLTYGMVSLIDVNVGRILDTLRALDLEQDTIVIFTSDHGDVMGDHWLMNKGPFQFEGLLKVPFIVRWPGKYASSREISCLTSHLDFLPTTLDILGLAYPEGDVPDPPEAPRQRPPLVGASMASLLAGSTEPIHTAVLVENDEDYIGSDLRTVITERYKLTCYSGHDFGELFDLQEDPDELHNLWDVPEHQTLKLEMKAKLLEMIMDTESPLPRRLSHA